MVLSACRRSLHFLLMVCLPMSQDMPRLQNIFRFLGFQEVVSSRYFVGRSLARSLDFCGSMLIRLLFLWEMSVRFRSGRFWDMWRLSRKMKFYFSLLVAFLFWRRFRSSHK